MSGQKIRGLGLETYNLIRINKKRNEITLTVKSFPCLLVISVEPYSHSMVEGGFEEMS